MVRSARRIWPFALATVLLAWMTAGALGAYHYVHNYWLYRGFPAPVTPKGIAPGRVESVAFYSRALGRRTSYMVYLPAGYQAMVAHRRRLGVLYLLHAPPGRADGFFLAGNMKVDADVLIARRRIPPMLLVVPTGRTKAYGDDTEWANAKAGRYESFVMDVVRNVDHRFATAANRAHRAIAGLSEGGYGAVNIALHHLGAFSAAQSWSGYFTQEPTASFTGATPAQLAANSPTDYVPRMARRIRRLGFRAWLYQGKTDFTAPWRILRFSRELAGTGAEVHYGFFSGGHDWGVWRRQAPRMLLAVGRWFGERPRAHQGALYELGHPLPHDVLHRILYNPRRHCLIRHPPRGYRFSRFCLAYRKRHLGAHGAVGHGARATGGRATLAAGPRGHKWVALTFDADMTRGMLAALRSGRQRTWYDARIVHTLQRTHTPATIFLTGLWAQRYALVVRRLARSPLFELENHSLDHAAWAAPCYGLAAVTTTAAKRRELQASARIIASLTGRRPRLFRFPGGCHTAADGRLVAALGERAVDWDVISGDAYLRTPSAVTAAVLRQVRPGSIIVMHLDGAPNAPATAAAVRAMIPALRARGYRFVTVRRLLAPCLRATTAARCATTPAFASAATGGVGRSGP